MVKGTTLYSASMARAIEDFRLSTDDREKKQLVAMIIAINRLTGLHVPEIIYTWIQAHR